MKAEDLKECPRCMASDGYERIITEESIRTYNWDGTIKEEKNTWQIGAAYCKCCGLVVLDEIERLRNE